MAMSPGAQFWEKRYIVWRQGGYHQNDSEGFLETLEWAVKRFKEQDEREAQKVK
jgi:hypothetical protein